MPRSVGGRLFGVVWINVGLVILAIYMGIVTSSLSSNSLEQLNNIYGMPVSVHALVCWRAFSSLHAENISSRIILEKQNDDGCRITQVVRKIRS